VSVPPCLSLCQVPPASAPTPGLEASKEYRTPAPNSMPQANVPVSGEERVGGAG